MSRLIQLFVKYPIILFIPLIINVILYASRFLYDPINFDEAYNLQVSVNLALHNEYASNGAEFDGTNKLFDPYISTGAPLLVPIGFAFKLFGIGVWQYRMITAAIYILLILLVILSIFPTKNSQKNKHLTYALSAIGVFLTLSVVNGSDNTSLLVAALGESLAIVFLLLSNFFLPKHVFTASLSVGLAILTKIIFFLAVPFFLLTVFLYYKKSTIFYKLSLIAKTTAGIILPLFLFECYRFISFNFNKANYISSINEFIKFFKKGGSGTNEISFTILSILKTKSLAAIHLNPVFDKWPIRIAVLILIAYSLLWLFSSIKKLKFTLRMGDNSILYFSGTALLWFSWWVIMSDSPYGRHIVPAVILLIILSMKFIIHTYVFVLDQSLHPAFLRFVNFFVIGLGIVVAIYGTPFTDRLLKQEQSIMAVKDFYANKKLYHIGWWQNPDVQFLLNTHSYPVETIKDEGFALISSDILNMQTASCSSTKELNDYYKVCRVIRKE